jgi:hypothetical protein
VNSLSLLLVQKGPVRSVSGDVLYSVRIHYFYMSTNRTLIEIFGVITDLDPDEKSAVLEAISDWEKSGDSENLREP